MISTVRPNAAARGTGSDFVWLCAPFQISPSVGRAQRGPPNGFDPFKSGAEGFCLAGRWVGSLRPGDPIVEHDAKVAELLPGVGGQAEALSAGISLLSCLLQPCRNGGGELP